LCNSQCRAWAVVDEINLFFQGENVMESMIISKNKAMVLCLIIMFSLPAFLEGSSDDTQNSLNPPPIKPALKQATGADRLLTNTEISLSIAVLGFGSFIFLIQVLLMWKKDFDYHFMLKSSAVSLVIIGTLFLITSGFSNDQIAPAMGLFGSIVGYLLGKESGKSDSG
jgi:hypothetical protein